jgi:hypothetical protein
VTISDASLCKPPQVTNPKPPAALLAPSSVWSSPLDPPALPKPGISLSEPLKWLLDSDEESAGSSDSHHEESSILTART